MRSGMKEEAGITEHSLHNARVLEVRMGKPVEVILDAGGSTIDHTVRAIYPSGAWFEFTGFAWSYCGEGPRGLLEFLRGLGFEISMQTISSWPEKDFAKRMVVGEGGQV